MASIKDLLGNKGAVHKKGIFPGDIAYDVAIFLEPEVVQVWLGNTSVDYAPSETKEANPDSHLEIILEKHRIHQEQLILVSHNLHEYITGKNERMESFREIISIYPYLMKPLVRIKFLDSEWISVKASLDKHIQKYQKFIGDMKLMIESVKYGKNMLEELIPNDMKDQKYAKLAGMMDQITSSYTALIADVRTLKDDTIEFGRFMYSDTPEMRN